MSAVTRQNPARPVNMRFRACVKPNKISLTMIILFVIYDQFNLRYDNFFINKHIARHLPCLQLESAVAIPALYE